MTGPSSAPAGDRQQRIDECKEHLAWHEAERLYALRIAEHHESNVRDYRAELARLERR